MRAGCIRIRKSKKAVKSNISCINFIKNRLTEAEGGESRGGINLADDSRHGCTTVSMLSMK
ncbi:putative peptidoglycan-associated lipoprotein [Trichinella spiralis]|uniref:putative peptidoglycan-associated lipoprotein n=1 Tax=Trichinella spiralis TaxID=6334 RepID=UPI0001EFF036|nr:putative peptidoglycan-associated lipoprotein [Trichinella spiralis]